jgi:hypothetical protein
MNERVAATIYERFLAGERIDDLTRDYRLPPGGAEDVIRAACKKPVDMALNDIFEMMEDVLRAYGRLESAP